MVAPAVWIIAIILVFIIGYAVYVEFNPYFRKKESGRSETKGYRGRITIISKYGLGMLQEKELTDKKLKVYNLYQVKPNGLPLPALTEILDDTIEVINKGEEFETWIIPHGLI